MAYESATDRTLWDEHTTVITELKAVVDEAHHPLIYRLANTACGAMASGEDRVLRVAGVLLAQVEQGHLFEQIFDAVIEGSSYNGGARQYLRDQLATLREKCAGE